MKRLIDFIQDESGATAIEYGLIVALIVIGIIASIGSIGQSFVVGPMSKVGSSLGR
jgi:pilus assembly protein Flp/PilA